MKKVSKALVALMLVIGSAFAQSSFAPDAVTMRVVKVVDLPTMKHDDFAEGGSGTEEETYGYKMTAVTASVKYELSCVIRLTTNYTAMGGQFTRYVEDDSSFVVQNNDGALTDYPQCTGFHVGERVEFYSLDNLIWLSYTDPKGNARVHSLDWKPKMVDSDFWTFEMNNGMFREQAYHIDSEQAITAAKSKVARAAKATRKKQPQQGGAR